MSKYEDPTQLDYRYGGDTVDDFAQKYMKTVAYIFSALNELRSPTGGTLTQNPEAYQLKVDDNKLYIRNQANTDWILLGDVQENFGFRTSASDAFMHESDVADSGKAGKLIRADASGKLNADILGNAAKIADKIFAPEDLQDGQIPVYRTSDGTWHAEYKGTVGAGKNLMIMDGDKMLGEYNGDEMKAIDIQKSSLTKALAESTGYGIVSGCEPTISGLKVTVGAGVIHLADGTRKDIEQTSVTLNNA